MSATMDRDRRICVVGAGPAGLSAAWHLQRLGYRRVTVLERNARGGGKCHSIIHEGRPYEFGAIDTLLGYEDVFEIARSVGAKLVANQRAGAYDPETKRSISILSAVFRHQSPLKVLAATVRYFYEMFKGRQVLKPGFAGVNKDLAKPFQHWIQENKLTPIQNAFILPVVACGYGRYDEISAAYVLKYMGIWNLLSCILGGLFGNWPKQFLLGFQDLWSRVAARLPDVRLNSRIMEISRKASISIRLQNESTQAGELLEFDSLILACPLDPVSLHFMDLRTEEKEMFGKIRYDKYFASLCHCPGIKGGFFLAELPVPTIGHPWGIIKQWPKNDLCVFYSPATPSTTADEILRFIQEDAKKNLRGKIQLIQQVEWDYFPHVTPEEFAGGYYDRLEALQGTNNTWFAGGLLNFETVATTVTYSKELVTKWFGT